MRSPEYNAWVAMRQRCINPNHPEYFRYGERGIKVCSEWNSYLTFHGDMGDRPSDKHSLERIDNNLGYCQINCKWEVKSIQSYNQRLSIDNRSGVIGVYQEKQTGLWKSYIRVNGKQITLGRTNDFFEACCIRKSAENKYYGRTK